MSMTHYMELLATNQPWNLILFMGIPIVLAETVAITELYILYTRNLDGLARWINRVAGVTVGLYFVGIIGYLLIHAVLPISRAGEWRTAIDMIAVGSYLLAGVPLVMIALQDLGIVAGSHSAERQL